MRTLFRLLTFLVVVAIGTLIWSQWDRLMLLIGQGPPEPPASVSAASPALADSADVKLESLRTGQVEQVAFNGDELQSLLLYRFVQLLPAFVDSPRVAIVGGYLEVTGRVPVDHLPSMSELGEAASFLPDTTEVGLRGKLLALDSGRVALSIDQVRAARIPLPARLVPKALERLGRKSEPGLPSNALALTLPSGVASAAIEGDFLILYARPQRRIEQP